MTSDSLAMLIGLAVALVAWAILDLLFSEERQVARRLRTLSDGERQQVADIEPLSMPFMQRVLRPLVVSLRRLLSRLAPKGYRERLQAKCRMAGFPGGVDEDTIVVFKILSATVAFGLVILIGVAAGGSIGRMLLFAVILVVPAWRLPDIWLSGQVTRRQNALRRELPDMLDMLLIAVEAGLGFDAAVTKYIRNRAGPLSDEFAYALREIQAGLARRDALRNLAVRCDVLELSSFIMALVQADVFGVSIGNVLRVQAREIRVKRRQNAEETAQKAPAKMVFPLVLCILPATLIVLATPAVIAIGRAFGSLE